MRRIIALAFITALGLLNTVYQGALASTMNEAAQATFKLYDGNAGQCSTTFLHNSPDGAFFLTAAHCVDNGLLNIRKQVVNDKFELLSEQIFYVKVSRVIKGKDIAVLQVLDKNVKFDVKPIDIASVEEAKKLKIGDPLMAVGYPAAEILAITKGEFTGIIPPMKSISLEAPMYQTTVPVAGGNSGGALYAMIDGTWKLIGTTTAKRRDNDIMTYFQTAETVQEVLKFVTNKAEPSLKADER